MVLEDGSDPKEVRHWQQQQAAEAELAAAEEAVTAGAKVPAMLEQMTAEPSFGSLLGLL